MADLPIIKPEQLGGIHVNGETISGLCLLKDVQRSVTKTNKPFYNGVITSGRDVAIKIWDNSPAFGVIASNPTLAGEIVYIYGTWNEYQGTYSIIVETIRDVEVDIDPITFYESRYDAKAYWEGLKQLISTNVTENAMKIANAVLFENEEVSNVFKEAFAAKSHHDNCRNGLLAHTYKLVYNASIVAQLYKGIVDKDLLMLGCLLHDVGKIREMKMGVYQPCAKVTHRFLGVELLDKQMICELYDEDWYYELVAILLQHHGEWGDPCKTVASRVVNLIDEYEAKLMLIKQAVDDSDNCGKINVDGNYLTYIPKPESDH